jgi:hypothetical protein
MIDRTVSGEKVLEWLMEKGRSYNQQATELTRLANGMQTLASIDYTNRADEVFRLADGLKREINCGRLDVEEG